MIRYKVVDKYRGSCFCDAMNTRLIYRKRQVVRKRAGTVGIFVFDTRENAKKFVLRYNCQSMWKIIRVRVVGRGERLRIRPTNFSPDAVFKFKDVFVRLKKLLTTCDGPLMFEYSILPEGFGLDYTNDGTMIYDAVIPID